MFRRKFLKDSGHLSRLVSYNSHAEKVEGFEKLIGGFRIIVGEIEGSDQSFKAYVIQKGLQNFLQALSRVKIPVMIIHCSLPEGENGASASYILTKAGDLHQLEERMRVVESAFMAVFPTFKTVKLSGDEIKKLLTFEVKLRNSSHSISALVHEYPEPTYSKGFDIPKFYVPILDRHINNSIIRLGYIVDERGDLRSEYYVTLNELSNHLVVFGSTGSGKTTTVSVILNQLPPDVHYMVFDFHNEYASKLTNFDIIVKPGKDDESAINPLDPSFTTDIAEHISLITEIFSETYNLTHPQTYLLKMCIESTLNNYKALGEGEANLRALVNMIEKHPLKSYYDHESKMALLRRLKPLIEGQAEKAFIGKRYLRISELVNKNTIIELGHFRETKIKQVYSQILLKQLYDYKTTCGIRSLDHVSIIEEARYLVPARKETDPPSIVEKMINELRKFGESVFLITQFPTQLSKDAIKNAGMIILHRIVGYEDLKQVASLIPLDEKQLNFLMKLDVGEGIVKDKRFHLPLHVKIVPRN